MGQAKRRGSRELRVTEAIKRSTSSKVQAQGIPAEIAPAYSSTAVKATRRILFNHLYQSVAERGHWHVDQMYGAGTGILIKYERAFYLLTADHVIRHASGYDFSNESPFWIPSLADSWPDELNGFMMPGQILHIGEASTAVGVFVDVADLVLIELFHPMHPRFLPDHFIDLDEHPEMLLKKEEFETGMLLIGAGYPFSSNDFEFSEHEQADGMTHFTRVNRWIVDGLCTIESGEPCMVRHFSEFPPLSGASGGIVTDARMSSNSTRMAGMLVSAGRKIVRFLPSFVIGEALQYKDVCRRTSVDPAFRGQPHPEFLDWFDTLPKTG